MTSGFGRLGLVSAGLVCCFWGVWVDFVCLFVKITGLFDCWCRLCCLLLFWLV